MLTQTDDIVRRVLDAVPAGSYAMSALLSLLRVEVTRKVPTAAVSCERRPVLVINPDFVDAHCRTDEHLFLLVMHELHHVLLGHTRLFPRLTPAHNVAFDAVINAMLVARFPQQAYTSFFTTLYGSETGALRLLAPPGEPPIADTRLRAVHEALYRSSDVTAQEIFELITREAPCSAIQTGSLLGSHDDVATGLDGDRTDGENFIAGVESIVQKWPSPGTSIGGRGLGGELTDNRLNVASPQQQVLEAMRRALLGATSRPGFAKRAIGVGRVVVETPLPHLRDRRAAVLRGAGLAPLLNRGELEHKTRIGGRAEVYLDVSGSVGLFLPLLYGGLRALQAHVVPRVHLFSTKVHTIPLNRLCSGEVKTTGGTGIGCVLDHMLERRPKRALVITDGLVGQPAAHVATQACRDIRVLLTPGGWRKDLAAIASRIDELPALRAS